MLGEKPKPKPKPAWLEALIAEETKFFTGCGAHSSRRKNEKNIFCLGCCRSICPHCLPSHPSHPLLQVRRYVYNDVVRLPDLQKLIDCSYVQPYSVNNAKVVFLKQRPHSRTSSKASAHSICLTCHRILQDPFRFCSLSCKVDYVGADVSSILERFNESDFAFSQMDALDDEEEEEEEDQVTQSSIRDQEVGGGLHSKKASSCSNNYRENSSSVSHNSEVVKMKKKANGFLSGIFSRRKGAPQRSPLS